jgi:hypothetical protein
MKSHKKTKFGTWFYNDNAETGHVATQAPQSMQVSSLHLDLPSSSNSREAVGQTPVHAPQPMHKSRSTFTGITTSF